MKAWRICPTCSGEGKHSRALGVVNPDDFSPDEWEDYLSGGYDQPCSTCEGTGKVREGEWEERPRGVTRGRVASTLR